MNKFIKSYTEIIFEDVLLEEKHEALSKWKDYVDVEEYIEKFMNKQNGIRLKIGKPYKNISNGGFTRLPFLLYLKYKKGS